MKKLMKVEKFIEKTKCLNWYKDYQAVEKLDAEAVQKPDIQRKMHFLKKKIDEINEKRKTEVLGNLKDLGNTLLGKEKMFWIVCVKKF